MANNMCLGESKLLSEVIKKLGLSLKDKSVTTSKLGDKAVTTVKLSDKSVTFEKLSDDLKKLLGTDFALEEYTNISAFPSEGAGGKLYIAADSKEIYHWVNGEYKVIYDPVVLGETSTTAYAGDKGKALATGLASHCDNNTVHVSTADRNAWNGKVDKEEGKSLTTNDLTAGLKNNYDAAYTHSVSSHAPSNAQKNVQSDWNQTDSTADDYIKNKPESLVSEEFVNNCVENLVGEDIFNGYDYVDLGLTTSSGNHLLWATCNIGAETPEDVGLYFQYGRADGYSGNSTIITTRPIMWGIGLVATSNVPPTTSGATYTNFANGNSVLSLADDAARVNMKGMWRMPTTSEYNLLKTLQREEVTTNGVITGYKIIGTNGNSIFFPFTGFFDGYVGAFNVAHSIYMRTSESQSSSHSYVTYISSSTMDNQTLPKYNGYAIRGVVEVSDEELAKLHYKFYTKEESDEKYSTKEKVSENTSSIKSIKDGMSSVKSSMEYLLYGNKSSEYVDLGLPSGTLWMKYNLGATSEYEVGNEYKWGEVPGVEVPKNTVIWDNEWALKSEYDAVYQATNGVASIPTVAQFEELIFETTLSFMANSSGTTLLRFNNKEDSSKYIIIPASSWLWTNAKKGGSDEAYFYYGAPLMEGNRGIDGSGNLRGVITPSNLNNKTTYSKSAVDALIASLSSRIAALEDNSSTEGGSAAEGDNIESL